MSHKDKSQLVKATDDTRGAQTNSGLFPGAHRGQRRSSGKKPSATNLSRGGGSAASTAHSFRGRSKSKSRRGN